MNNITDNLIDEVIRNKSSVVVGLDPIMSRIPYCYKIKYLEDSNPIKASAQVIIDFNKDVIDSIKGLVCAVKPQIAFYEMYGHYGIEAFEHTIKYAKSQGLIVIEDGKRNDIGNTAAAYSSSHLGEVELLNNSNNTIFDVDYLTVSPYLGRESIEPFIKDAEKYNKGIFILVKTSNPNSGDIQDKTILDGITISELIAKYVNDQSCRLIGNKYGYSSLGAVVGATYPVHAKQLRRIMPNSIFLVPGYGAQGANTESILNCFNDDGLGAIVNSSRNILYSYENIISSEDCDISTFKNSVRNSCEEMKEQIYYSLKQNKPQIKY